jgi:chemotaxis protein CheZ
MPDTAKTIKTAEITEETQKQAQDLMNALHGQINTFEHFVARRFDELSMEINATAQQVDMVEDGIGKRFGEILGVLGSVAHHGEGLTPANAGVELDAVIKTTEDAANTILDAADSIAQDLTTTSEKEWTEKESRDAVLKRINRHIHEILLACTFQDLTGQRITKAIENLRGVESQLNSTLQALGIDVQAEDIQTNVSLDNAATSQDDIDALFK